MSRITFNLFLLCCINNIVLRGQEYKDIEFYNSKSNSENSAIEINAYQSPTYILNPEWFFADNFESDTGKIFWKDKSYVQRSAEPSIEASHNSKVLLFKFCPNAPEQGSSWSEQRFSIPINAVQIEMSFDQYVPSNYVYAPGNQKGFTFWSGNYGNPNIFVSTEEWPSDSGAKPSINIVHDGINQAHTHLNSSGDLMWHNNQGSWQHMHIYLKLAENDSDSGCFEIFRDGIFLIGTGHPKLKINQWSDPKIYYSMEGNYIDQGYLMGWVNGGFKEITEFYIDNFVIKANSVVGETTKDNPTNIIKEKVNLPSAFLLSQNYPNPFNPSTTIKYSLPVTLSPLPAGRHGVTVSLKILDILGREVTTLVNEHKPAGTYTVEWNGTNSAGQQVGSGIYFYQLKTSNGFMETKKMLLIK